jgi:hypothetical protein
MLVFWNWCDLGLRNGWICVGVFSCFLLPLSEGVKSRKFCRWTRCLSFTWPFHFCSWCTHCSFEIECKLPWLRMTKSAWIWISFAGIDDDYLVSFSMFCPARQRDGELLQIRSPTVRARSAFLCEASCRARQFVSLRLFLLTTCNHGYTWGFKGSFELRQRDDPLFHVCILAALIVSTYVASPNTDCTDKANSFGPFLAKVMRLQCQNTWLIWEWWTWRVYRWRFSRTFDPVRWHEAFRISERKLKVCMRSQVGG